MDSELDKSTYDFKLPSVYPPKIKNSRTTYASLYSLIPNSTKRPATSNFRVCYSQGKKGHPSKKKCR